MNVLFPLAVMAMSGVATLALADDVFPLPTVQDSTSYLYYDHLTTNSGGVVEVYDYDGHAIGRLLGSKALAAGTNQNLRIIMNPPPPVHDVMTLLIVNGQVMDRQVTEFDHNR